MQKMLVKFYPEQAFANLNLIVRLFFFCSSVTLRIPLDFKC